MQNRERVNRCQVILHAILAMGIYRPHEVRSFCSKQSSMRSYPRVTQPAVLRLVDRASRLLLHAHPYKDIIRSAEERLLGPTGDLSISAKLRSVGRAAEAVRCGLSELPSIVPIPSSSLLY
jgi:hypothetical protein